MVFLAWHIVWFLTGLNAPAAADHHGVARILFYVFSAVVYLMVVVGTLLPLALANQSWGRRIPRWMLMSAAWTGSALLSARGLAGIVDDFVRAIGVLPNGLTGLTTAQTLGTDHPSSWAVFAGCATDLLFAIGGLLFGLAALSFQRASVRLLA